MKKILMVLTLACVALLLTQCKKGIVEQPNVTPCSETIEVSLNADNGCSKTIIDGTTIKWRVGDKLHVVGETDGYLGFISAQNEGTSAYFTGTITKPSAISQYLRFYYIGNSSKQFTLVNGNYTHDISSQQGTIEDIENNLHLMYGRSNSTVAAGATNLGSVTMTSLIAVAHFNFDVNRGNFKNKITCEGTYSSVSIDVKSGAINIETGNIGAETTGNITLNNVTKNSSYYMALLPGVQTITFSQVYTNTNITVAEVELESKTIEVNKFYNVSDALTVTMRSTLPEDALNGIFTVDGSGKKVYFSKANVVYEKGTLKFHDHQYDICFRTNGQDVSGQYNTSGTFDLFSWGTGDNPVNIGHYPSTGVQPLNNAGPSGTYYNHDWGSQISPAKTWFTISSTQLDYILNTRGGSNSSRYAKATVNDGINEVMGIIILPDDWDVNYSGQTQYQLSNINVSGAAFTGNNISSTAWQAFEYVGAAFLPHAGYCSSNAIITNNDGARYWNNSNSLRFNSAQINANNTANYGYGFAVRVVAPANY